VKTHWTHELPVGDIDPLLVEKYLTSHGWKEVASRRPGLLVFEGPKDDDGEPIIQVIPQSAEAPDYGMRARELITALSVIENRRALDVIRDIVAREGSISPGSERNALGAREQPVFSQRLLTIAVAASFASLTIALSTGAVAVLNEARYRQVYSDLHTLRSEHGTLILNLDKVEKNQKAVANIVDEFKQQRADLARQMLDLAAKEEALERMERAILNAAPYRTKREGSKDQ